MLPSSLGGVQRRTEDPGNESNVFFTLKAIVLSPEGNTPPLASLRGRAFMPDAAIHFAGLSLKDVVAL
jgi:hypothetical protein